MRSRAPAPPRTAQWARHTWSRGRPRSAPGGETWARNLTPLPSLRNASLSVALPTRRPQIARSMRLRLTLLVATWLPALTGGANLAAQEASPYVPLGHWVMPYVEHLIAAGVIRDPTPLTRPFHQGDLVRALEAVDTQPLSRATRATLHQLEAALGNGQRSEEHTSELQSRLHLVCRLLLEKKKKHSRQQRRDTHAHPRLASDMHISGERPRIPAQHPHASSKPGSLKRKYRAMQRLHAS